MKSLTGLKKEGGGMKTICAWCGKLIKAGSDSLGRVSHGICKSCAVVVEDELKYARGLKEKKGE